MHTTVQEDTHTLQAKRTPTIHKPRGHTNNTGIEDTHTLLAKRTHAPFRTRGHKHTTAKDNTKSNIIIWKDLIK